MVQSLGISVGNLNSYVAAGLGGGIELLLNEFSNRSTPSMVAFTDRSRCIGTEASSNQFMNVKNTIYDLMFLLGKSFKDVNSEHYPYKIEPGQDDQILVVVRHLGCERKFTLTQVLGMLFTKLRSIAGDSTDCVLSCPQYFNDNQKAAIMQAALIAGLNPLQIITDMSAVVLNYAYYRTTKNDPDKFIAFINVGQSNMQSVIAWLNPKKDVVRILAAESEPIGGKDFDRCLADHFVKTHNLKLSQKSYLKLISACEKLKRLLSANANEIPLNVESLISEDQDFTSRIDRATFEKIIEHLLQQASHCLNRTFTSAIDNYSKITAEIVEAERQARQAAAAKKVKAKVEKKVEPKPEATDSEPKVELANGDVPMQDDSGVGDTPPSEQVETGDGKPQEIKSKESNVQEPAPSPDVPVTNTAVYEPKPFALDGVEVVGGSIRIPAIKQLIQNVFDMTPSTTLNTDEAVARGCVLQCATLHPGMKVKREVKILNVEPYTKPSGFNCDKDLRRVELELITQDRKYMARTEARNNLEEFIYSERSKLLDGDPFLTELTNELDWLFSEEGEDATEDIYTSKLASLRKPRSEPIAADQPIVDSPAAEPPSSEAPTTEAPPINGQQATNS